MASLKRRLSYDPGDYLKWEEVYDKFSDLRKYMDYLEQCGLRECLSFDGPTDLTALHDLARTHETVMDGAEVKTITATVRGRHLVVTRDLVRDALHLLDEKAKLPQIGVGEVLKELGFSTTHEKGVIYQKFFPQPIQFLIRVLFRGLVAKTSCLNRVSQEHLRMIYCVVTRRALDWPQTIFGRMAHTLGVAKKSRQRSMPNVEYGRFWTMIFFHTWDATVFLRTGSETIDAYCIDIGSIERERVRRVQTQRRSQTTSLPSVRSRRAPTSCTPDPVDVHGFLPPQVSQRVQGIKREHVRWAQTQRRTTSLPSVRSEQPSRRAPTSCTPDPVDVHGFLPPQVTERVQGWDIAEKGEPSSETIDILDVPSPLLPPSIPPLPSSFPSLNVPLSLTPPTVSPASPSVERDPSRGKAPVTDDTDPPAASTIDPSLASTSQPHIPSLSPELPTRLKARQEVAAHAQAESAASKGERLTIIKESSATPAEISSDTGSRKRKADELLADLAKRTADHQHTLTGLPSNEVYEARIALKWPSHLPREGEPELYEFPACALIKATSQTQLDEQNKAVDDWKEKTVEALRFWITLPPPLPPLKKTPGYQARVAEYKKLLPLAKNRNARIQELGSVLRVVGCEDVLLKAL